MKTVEELVVAISHLERTPLVLRAWLQGQREDILSAPEAEGMWSAKQIVGHYIYGEQTDWIPRAKRILEHGESKEFDRFDRNGNIAESQQASLEGLLSEFQRLREKSLAELKGLNLTNEHLARKGKHPALGTVTLGQLLASWVAHDLTHIHQLSRVLASPYREKIGPWTEYMGVMKCNGHG